MTKREMKLGLGEDDEARLLDTKAATPFLETLFSNKEATKSIRYVISIIVISVALKSVRNAIVDNKEFQLPPLFLASFLGYPFFFLASFLFRNAKIKKLYQVAALLSVVSLAIQALLYIYDVI